MQVSLSTKSIHGVTRIGADPEGVLGESAQGITVDAETFFGRNALEGCGEKGFDADAVAARFRAFVRDCVRSGVRIHAMRMPRLRWDTKRTDLRELLLRFGWEGIEACAGSGCHFVVMQPLFAGIDREQLWRDNRRYYAALGRMAQRAGVKILLENQCGHVNGHFVRGVCADAAVAAEWIDALNAEAGAETFGFCLDTGAGNLCRQDMGEMAVTLGSRLKAVLVRECDGVREASRLPFTGRTAAGQDADWPGLIRGLRKSAFDGILILDAGDTLRGFSHLLRPQVQSLVCAVAEYFRWQIGMERCLRAYPSRVLFGAGNMCRQYLARYGEAFPPLFICDNDRERWGTEVCGVEVRPPEALRELPEDCVVMICNTFYEETAEQLRELGVRRIGAFSDECL